jgi:Sigma-70 factor, region 1.1
VKSEQIEDILAKFSEMGVNVVDTNNLLFQTTFN